MVKKSKRFSIFQKKETKRNKDLLVAASVIAAMAYQAALSPPGGVAAMDATKTDLDNIYDYNYILQPGASLLAYFYSDLSNLFWISNTISLMAALSVIFLYVSGLSLRRKILIWFIRLAMWITLSSMTVAYACAVIATTPDDTSFGDITITVRAIVIGVIAWVGLIILSLFVLFCLFVSYIARKIKLIILYIVRNIIYASEVEVEDEDSAAPDMDIV